MAGCQQAENSCTQGNYRIIVQGGAYRTMPPDKKEEYKRATKESARKGYDILRESAENALEKMKRLVNGYGGVVTIDKEGNFGKAFTTNMMVWASIKGNTMEFGMEKDKVDEVEQLHAYT